MGKSQLQADPCLGPVIWTCWPAREGIQQLQGKRRVWTGGAHDCHSPPHGEGRALHDLLGMDREQLQRNVDTTLGKYLEVVEPALQAVDGAGNLPDDRGSLADSPGDRPACPAGELDGRRVIKGKQPVLMGDLKLESSFKSLQCFCRSAHLVVTLTHHGVVTDRVDPAALGAAYSRPSCRIETPAGTDKITVAHDGLGKEILLPGNCIEVLRPGLVCRKGNGDQGKKQDHPYEAVESCFLALRVEMHTDFSTAREGSFVTRFRCFIPSIGDKTGGIGTGNPAI